MSAGDVRLMTRRQQEVARRLSEGAPMAPPRLRSWVETETARARTRRRPAFRRLPAPPVPAAGLVAVLAALALALPALVQSGPRVIDAHALSSRGPTAEAPLPEAGRPALLDRRFAGVAFPNWSTLDWVATGERKDELDGRRTATVYYAHTEHKRGQHTIAYTIVSGEPLDLPEDAQMLRLRGLELALFRHGAHEVAVFERGGRTCVLTAHVLETSTLLKLASWKAGGEVTF